MKAMIAIAIMRHHSLAPQSGERVSGRTGEGQLTGIE